MSSGDPEDWGQSKVKPFRPFLHITASGWINDPCAPAYDPQTKTYHIFYQCNPYGTDWGNMSWGHIISKDLLKWTHTSPRVVLKPDQDYDRAGVFTGGIAPESNADDTRLTVFYSSIRHMPFHWSTLPYPRNAAGIATATSQNGGRTWQKSANNPILEGEPGDIAVTGYRDPYIAPWPELSSVRRDKDNSLYAVVSGGVVETGPTSFLYAVNPNNLESWDYLGPLIDLPQRLLTHKKWGGQFGVNWECVNFMTLISGSASRNFLIIGAESDVEREHIKQHQLPRGISPRTVRHQVWLSGDLVNDRGSLKITNNRSGTFDHGIYYAANSFVDLPKNRRVVHGWISDEDISPVFAKQRGWNGALALPREVFLQVIPNVTRAIRSPLSSIVSMDAEKCLNDTVTMYTLGVKLIDELADLRRNCISYHGFKDLTLPLQGSMLSRPLCSCKSPIWELSAIIEITLGCNSVGFYIKHNQNYSIATTIIFSPQHETLTVQRSRSTPFKCVNTCPESGPFTLFTTLDPGSKSEKLESFQLRMISDGDVLEVFANERFALATTVYSGDHAENGGISVFADGEIGSAVFRKVEIWDGLNAGESCISEGVGNDP